MFGSPSKPHLWMELQTKSGMHVELSALQNGYLEFSDFWVFGPNFFQKHYILKMSIKSICFLKIYNLGINAIGESAHITHSAQSRTNVRKSLIVCNMTWRETSCGYHRIPSTAPPWPDTIMTPYHKFWSSCSAFVNIHLLLHPVNMPPCKLHGLALSYFSWVTKWSMLEPCTVRWK